MRRLDATLRLRCPRCLEGPLWRSFLTMHDRCPVCDLRFEREPGYFTGAMVVAYALGVAIFGLLTVALIVGGLEVGPALLAGGIVYLVLAPFVMRYSRAIWLHFDWLVDPER